MMKNMNIYREPMRFKLLFVTIMVSIFSVLTGQAQNNSGEEVSRKFQQYSQRAVQEKLYLHLDRSFYLVGETMWFKAYSVNAATSKYMDLSKVAYLEVMDKEQNALVQTKFSLSDGKGNGSLVLPSALLSGNYKVRCYTNWMKNFSSDFFFETEIRVVNPFVKFDPNPDEKAKLTYDIQFFPEGGHLVKDIESKVGFRAVASDGKGFYFKGALINQNSDTLVRFEPRKFGIGNFTFKPESATGYKVVIRDRKGNSFTYSLPEIKEQGYVMQVREQSAKEIVVSVTGAGNENVSIFTHTHQDNRYTETKALVDGKVSFTIDKNKFGDGISHITVFSASGNPVCERLYFKRPSKDLMIDGKVSKDEYVTRDRVVMDLSTSSDAGIETLSDLSVSVFLADSIQTKDQESISSYLFLSSDLKGSVESPEYYLQKNNKEVDVDIDNLMLTHGWRRFQWDNVLKENITYPNLPEFDGHFIFGKVISTVTGEPAKNIGTYLAAPDSPARLYFARSNEKGEIRFEVKEFFGPKEVTIQTNLRQDSTYRFEMANPFSKSPLSSGLSSFQFDKTLENTLLTRSINMQTTNAFLPKWYKEAKYVFLDSLAFFGAPDEKYFLDDFTRFPTMEEVMREYVRGVMVRRRQKEFHFIMMDKLFPQTFFTEDPLILLDGIPIFNTDKIMAFDPLKVKKIELMSARYFLGFSASTGIVSLSTYRGDLAGFELDPRILVMPYEGPQIKREFYTPKYDTPVSLQSRIPDFRNLLYWVPDVVTDAQGKSQISFYTSDQTGHYRVVVQGMTKNGLVGSKTFSFEVTRRNL
ncbi:hypothetical protein SAMN04487995_5658 [Dyadobacter koreensis]|uniref:MG2 domain-containing protein n=2 Tax=Dyadobacter koreensis TaxID=408657 RepID=A0A1H7AE83_9BACT|nr:hypothetical protein SAMN04487995_5658 [Dyadobacter koreensis]